MEEALRYEIMQVAPELEDEIYYTNAPETHSKPYMISMRTKTERVKTLEGYTNKQALRFMWNIMATKYNDMKTIRGKLEDLLMRIIKTRIGANKDFYVEDIDIEDINETYEFNLKVNRGIIIFTIYF